MNKTFGSRLSDLEKAFTTHLIESGEIRGDLKWLKRGYWVMITGLITILARVMYK